MQALFKRLHPYSCALYNYRELFPVAKAQPAQDFQKGLWR
jgi:hypothetical protein